MIVDYAHTPGGIAAVLASARPLANGRLLCVFGAGGDRDHAKRPLMGAAAEAGADRVYVTSDNSRSEPTERSSGDPRRPRAARGCARRARPPPRDRARARRRRAGRPRDDPRQGPRAGPGHRTASSSPSTTAPWRRSCSGAARDPARGGRARRDAPAQRRSGHRASRASSPIRAPPGRARSSARSRASAPTATTSSTPCARPARSPCSAARPLAPARGPLRARGRRAADGARRDRPAGAACMGREGDRHRRIEWQDVHEGHARRALRPARADTRHPSQPQQPPRPAVDALPARAAARALHLRARHERGRRARPSSRRSRSPSIGVITNIAPEHLEFLGDLEGVAREEASLLARLPAGRRRRAAGGRAAARPLPARGRAHDDVRRARRRRPLPHLGAGRAAGRARCSTCSASAASWSCRCAPRTTPPISPPRPPPTSAPGLPLDGSGRGRRRDRALAAARAGAGARAAAACS